MAQRYEGNQGWSLKNYGASFWLAPWGLMLLKSQCARPQEIAKPALVQIHRCIFHQMLLIQLLNRTRGSSQPECFKANLQPRWKAICGLMRSQMR